MVSQLELYIPRLEHCHGKRSPNVDKLTVIVAYRRITLFHSWKRRPDSLSFQVR